MSPTATPRKAPDTRAARFDYTRAVRSNGPTTGVLVARFDPVAEARRERIRRANTR